MSANYTIAAMIPLIIAALLFFGTLALNVFIIRLWRGWSRLSACLPIVALVIWSGVIIFSIILDPAAHNLWPLELILWSASALVVLGIIALLKRIIGTK